MNKSSDAKVIGVDVSFFEPSEEDYLLNQTLEGLDNIVLAGELNNNELYKPIFNKTFGYVNLITDGDGIARRVGSHLIPEANHFAFEVFYKYSGTSTRFQGEHLINYASNPGSFNSISTSDFLNQQVDVKDKIVLIGATAPNLHDVYFVPTSEGIAMPGVEIHANIIQNLILDNFLIKQSRLNIILLVILTSLFSFFFLSRIKIYYALPSVLLFLVIYLFISIFLFGNFNYVLDLFFVPLTLFIFLGVGMGINFFEEQKHSGFLKQAFGKYISQDLLNEIVNKKQQLKLGGAKREITIFFSDIRGFTSISEKLSPDDLVGLLNDYLTEMTKIILEYRGTVDKFIGDAVMAFWNAPLLEKQHALLACQSAIKQVEKLKELNKILAKNKFPKLAIGCGLHTGEAIIGNMGSEERFDYTAMGDSVNLSSRLEGLTKQYGVDIIISETTQALVKNKLETRRLDKVKVKGKKKPIVIYELLVGSSKDNLEFSRNYEKALKLYFKKDFKKALNEFEKIEKTNSDDVSTKVMIQRCKEFIQNPPKNWDGSFELKSK